MNTSVSNSKDKTDTSSFLAIGNFLTLAQFVYPDEFLLKSPDFESNYHVDTPEIVVKKIIHYLAQEVDGSLDFFDVFLSAEKHQKIDRRESEDLLAMEFVNSKINHYKMEVKKLLTGVSIWQEQLEFLRKIVIEGPLKNYKKGHPNLTTTLLGWGGNCVAQTMFIIGLLSPYRSQLPQGQKLGVAQFTDHLEPILIDGGGVTFLVSGKKVLKTGARLYKPEFLLYLLLKKYDATQQSTVHVSRLFIKARTKSQDHFEI
ncbi:MAG: hypothetical protein K1X29_10980 [Bdellovibrionales bacterium]|nr:hypothetical protein [Bdellovibrionales bacterium]